MLAKHNEVTPFITAEHVHPSTPPPRNPAQAPTCCAENVTIVLYFMSKKGLLLARTQLGTSPISAIVVSIL